ADGAEYSFPWHRVEGDVRVEGVPPQSMRFELDRGRLLDLLVGHTIYNDPTVAIRELLQNSIDATRYQLYLDRKAGMPITTNPIAVNWDRESRLLTVEDKGTGMDHDVIVHHLMSVGSSFYNTPEFETHNRGFTPISRFGIGILTCFMVSDDIEIVTIRGGEGHRLKMTSVQSSYLLRKLALSDPKLASLGPHGTRVTLRIRDSVDLRTKTVEQILRHWVVLPECPVQFQEGPSSDPLEI